MSGERFIGIDIGGTSTRIAHSTSLEVPLLEDKTVFPTTNNFEQDYQRITEYVDANAPINRIGIGIPGTMNQEKSFAISGNHTPGFINKPLPELLSKKYNCKTHMDNDGVVAALGEALYGTNDKSDFIYVIWGTGVGGASVVYQDGKPTISKLDWNTYFRDWEEACGGNSMQRKYDKSVKELSDQNWEEVMERFSNELLSFSDKLHPRRIIFGGGIAIKQAERLKEIVGHSHERFPNQTPLIETSKLEEDAGLYGALGLLQL